MENLSKIMSREKENNAEKEPCIFNVPGGYCPDCGTILPIHDEAWQKQMGNFCYGCQQKWQVFEYTSTSFTITLNKNVKKIHNIKLEKDNPGQIVIRTCPMCDNNKMRYATMQLRSADEGQTVFYTCIKCNHKETENS